jgi:hypothetical protein
MTTMAVLLYNIDENLNKHYERELYRIVVILSFFQLFHLSHM